MLARSGLARRTALGTTTLLIGANLPDVDIVTVLLGPAAHLGFRRGWTHGVLALAAWPFLLTGAMIGAAGVLGRVRRTPLPSEVVPRALFFLSAIAILSHPALDTLNTYGVRWLMPFSGRWFYGDTLFIVDPWLWLALGAGLVMSRLRRGAIWPARVALGVGIVYVALMAASALAARGIARREIAGLSGQPVGRLMVSPLPVNPFRRRVVAEQEDVYRTARFDWLATPEVDPASVRILPKGPADHPAVRAARTTALARRFLRWARYPAYQVESVGGAHFLVHIIDLRYADRPGVRFGAVSIPVTIPP